jgi:two-component system response regulator AtoC
MGKYPANTIPKELEKYFWLLFFTAAKYLLLLYDEKGYPLWCAHQTMHKHRELLESLMSGPCHQFYTLPVKNDLNRLFDVVRKKGNGHYFLAPIDNLDAKDFRAGIFPGFPSNNIIEERTLMPFLSSNFPLSYLSFARINKKRFIGLVKFPDILNELIKAENKTAVFTDDNDVIIGFNSLFMNMTRIDNPKKLLGKVLSDIVSFSRPPVEPAADLLPFTGGFSEKWDAGEEIIPFIKEGRHRDFSFMRQGLLCENKSKQSHHYHAWRIPLPIDNFHFRIDIDFMSSAGSFPNTILRGIQEKTNHSRDIIGYSLSMHHDNTCAFKKAGDIFRFLPIEPIRPEKSYTLTIQKKFQHYSSFLNQEKFGAWEEKIPFIMKSHDILYLFQKPGDKIILQSFRMNRVPIKSDDPPSGLPLRASFKISKEKNLQFNVSAHQGVMHLSNYTLYLFEDITDLKTDIDNLTQQRDKLSALIKQERVFVGETPAIQRIREQIKTVADSDMTVLLEGETGTGKEILAQSIHDSSPRKDKPLIKIDCAAIPRELIESELFGHEKGAFTGAVAAHSGKFEQAQGGTVYLDEIENLPVNVQAKLLNVLEDRKVIRVGGVKSMNLDIRLLAASNAPLKELIREGRFRSDLFYRLNQVRLVLPPLRERKEDIPFLANHFIKLGNRAYRRHVRGLTENALKMLFDAKWFGNVRELRNVIFRAILFCKSEEITEEDLIIDETMAGSGVSTHAKRHGGGFHRPCIIKADEMQKALEASAGIVAQAAKGLGISRMMAYKLIKRFGIDLVKYRQDSN